MTVVTVLFQTGERYKIKGVSCLCMIGRYPLFTKEKTTWMSRISVIIPIYNVERYIRECLQSVARQSFSAYEVLMVDDGSTDQSGRIAQGNIQTGTISSD